MRLGRLDFPSIVSKTNVRMKLRTCQRYNKNISRKHTNTYIFALLFQKKGLSIRSTYTISKKFQRATRVHGAIKAFGALENAPLVLIKVKVFTKFQTIQSLIEAGRSKN